MSDTPETDAVVRDEGLSPHPYIELARRLERERDAARAAMQHEREGYECAIAYGYAADAQRERAEKAEAALADLKIKMAGNSRDYEVLLAELGAEIARLRKVLGWVAQNPEERAYWLGSVTALVAGGGKMSCPHGEWHDTDCEICKQLDVKDAEIARLRDVLASKGFVECGIPACGCGSWHHKYGLPERWAEIKEVLIDADVLNNGTGNTPLNAIKKLISQLAELQKRLADAGEGLPPTMPGFPQNAIDTVDDFVEVKEYAVALRAAAESIIARKDAEIARLRELLQQIVRHHDEAMRAAVGDEANYHQMRKNQVLFHLTPNAQEYSAEDAFNAGMTRAVDIAKAIAESESEDGRDNYGVGWQIADRILKARKVKGRG